MSLFRSGRGIVIKDMQTIANQRPRRGILLLKKKGKLGKASLYESPLKVLILKIKQPVILPEKDSFRNSRALQFEITAVEERQAILPDSLHFNSA